MKPGHVMIGVGFFWWIAAAGGAQNVVVILDDSGSMGERMRSQRNTTRMEAAKDALVTVLEQLPDDAHVGVATLNQRGPGSSPWIIPLGPVEISEARAAIATIRPEGGTPLGAFLKLGADALLEKRAVDHYGRFRLLVVTDGEANDGARLESYLPDVLSRGIVVDVIGVDMKSDHSLATKVHSYRRADDAATLTAAVQEVFAETSADSGDAGAEDFEILQALPSEVAAAVLAALAESDNEPIGAMDRRGARAGEGDRSSSRPNRTNNRRQRNRLPWWVMLVIAYAAFSVLRTAFKQKR